MTFPLDDLPPMTMQPIPGVPMSQPVDPASQQFRSAGALNDTDARLILELVSGIDPPAEIMQRYGLTEEQLKAKLRSPGFRSAYQEAARVWKSSPNVKERIRMRAGALLEDSLQDIFLIIKNVSLPASQRLEATKQLGQLSQTINPKEQQGTGAAFTINIVRRGHEPVTINAEPNRTELTTE